MSVVKKQQLIKIFMIMALIIQANALHAWGSNARNDPYPMYTSLDPQYFLYEREKQLLFGMADEKGTPESVMLSLSPFGQNADNAKTINATYCADPMLNTCATTCNNIFCSNCTTPTAPTCINSVEIGDIDGRWNLLGLLAGQVPASFNPADNPLYMNAFNTLLKGGRPGLNNPGDVTEQDIQIATDNQCTPLFGYVSAPVKYRKRGIRWDFEAQLCGDLGFQFQGGLVEISQVLNRCLINLTTSFSGTATSCSGITFDPNKVTCTLFDELVPLARQLGFNVCNFNKWGVEDLYFSFYWRHAYVLNYDRDLSWARALVIPFLRFGASAPAGRAKEQDFFFSLPFGNNGSASVDINAGMNFDFSETVEIGAEFGYSHFFKKDFDNFRAPTNFLQSSIFPFATPASVQPGDTAYVAGKLAAYHFIDRLSFYGQWVYVHHQKDKIELINPDPAFLCH